MLWLVEHYMNPFLPSRALPLLALYAIAIQGLHVFGQEEDPPFEPLEKLVFVDAHFDEVGGVDGLDGTYDMVVSPDGQYLYVASMNDDAIAVFDRNPATGELSFISRSKNGEGGIDGLNGARSLDVSPDGEFLYVVSMFDDALVTFSRNILTGSLTFLGRIKDGETGVDGLDGARSVSVSPDGLNLYVAGWDDNAVALFSRETATGVASFLGRLKHGEDDIFALDAPHSLTISPDGKNLYITLWDEDAVSVYNRDRDTGLLTYNSKISNGLPDAIGNTVNGLEGSRAAIASPDGNQLYVVGWNDDSLTTFNRSSTGALEFVDTHQTGIGGVEGLDGAHSLAISADGKFVYVAAFFDDAITVFSRDTVLGILTYDQTIYSSDDGVEGLNGSLTIMASPDGEHVYSTSVSEKSLVSFRRELIIDPPIFAVEPLSKSVPANSGTSFNALAEGINLTYQWKVNGVDISGATDPAYTIDVVEFGLNGNVYTVEASNPGGSILSLEAVLTVLPEITLETPESLTALTQSSSSAVLNWVDTNSNETGFEIQRKIAGESFETVAQIFGNNETFLDSDLLPGTEYIYRLRATRPGEVSEWSNEAVIESFDEAPNTPANLILTLEEYNRIGLQWSDRSAVEDGFLIERQDQTVGGSFLTVGDTETSITSFLDRTVAPGSSYVYRVRAYNESGASGYSNTIVAQTLAVPVTSITPTSRTVPATQTSGNLVLVASTKDWEVIPDVDWIVIEEPADGVGTGNEPVSYRVLESQSIDDRVGTIEIGGLVHTVTQEGAVYFIEAIPAEQYIGQTGGSYSFSIASNTSWTLSTNSPWIQITSQANGTGNGTVTFDASANLTGSDRIGTIYTGDGTHTVYQSPGNTQQDPPSPPTGGESNESSTDGILVTWSDTSDHELGYIIERTELGLSDWKEIARVPANTTSYFDTDIVPSVAYSYRISAYNENGISDPTYIDSDGVIIRSRLVNLSTRGFVGTGEEVLIAGFGVKGSDSIKLMSRSVGPRLADFQIANTLVDPVMSVRVLPEGNEIANNDDWSQSLSESELMDLEGGTGAFSLSTSSKDSVVVGNYNPGLYTNLLSDSFGSTGIALLEVYELSSTRMTDSRLINLSTRGYVGEGEAVLIGGFVIEGESNMNLLIRGVGPGLSGQGIANPLVNPKLTLYSGSDVLAENDDWGVERANEKSQAFADSGAFDLEIGSRDAAMLVTLAQGLYTVVLNGAAGQTGVALFEIYVLED